MLASSWHPGLGSTFHPRQERELTMSSIWRRKGQQKELTCTIIQSVILQILGELLLFSLSQPSSTSLASEKVLSPHFIISFNRWENRFGEEVKWLAWGHLADTSGTLQRLIRAPRLFSTLQYSLHFSCTVFTLLFIIHLSNYLFAFFPACVFTGQGATVFPIEHCSTASVYLDACGQLKNSC